MTMHATDKTKVKRSPKRGAYDADTIHRILDADFVCQVAFVYEGYPVSIPTLYGRVGNKLYLHGATSSRMMKAIEGHQVCVSITLVDGLVLARSAFHHSMNYRSVMVFGTPVKVAEAEKNEALKVISDHMLAGRWEDARLPNSKELKATTVLELSLQEASAKVRTGPPADDKEDYSLDVWAGVVPINRAYGKPESDETGVKNLSLPSYLKD